MFSDNNRIKLETNSRKIAGKYQDIWRLNKALLYRTWLKEEISGEKFNLELKNTELTNICEMQCKQGLEGNLLVRSKSL